MSTTEAPATDPGVEQAEGQPTETETPDAPAETPEVPLEEPETPGTETPDVHPEDPIAPDEQTAPAPEGPGPIETPVPATDPEEGQQEPSVPVPPPATETQQMAAFDKAFKRAKRYADGVMGDLEEGARDLLACPRCQDFLPGFILSPEVKPVDEQTRVAVRLSMGDHVEPSYKQSDKATTCSKCDGWGKVATGSKVVRQDKVTCPECAGRGWTGPLQANILQQPELAQPLEASENGGEPEHKPLTDPWGRVPGDSLYGVMPGYES